MILPMLLAALLGIGMFTLFLILLVFGYEGLANWKAVYRNDLVHYRYRIATIVVIPLSINVVLLIYGVLRWLG